MTYAAVIFDLFGTLIDERPGPYAKMMATVARLLGVELDALYAASLADVPNRDTGVYLTTNHQFAALCQTLGISPSPEHFAAAIEEYTDLQRSRLVPREGVIETLIEIKARGLKRGLISNTAPIITSLWPDTVFPAHLDAVVLSAEVKVRKPDPAIYLIACNQLRVRPEDCLYIGDGGANELTGAANVGMTPILIAPPYDDAPALGAQRQPWDGTRIAFIPEVLDLL
ncbi:MAG: HAD-IA family hydrolase [Chloroflexi bacterium]|nr:HAD-IA family hydrolase [Chloroflexota bacterium]